MGRGQAALDRAEIEGEDVLTVHIIVKNFGKIEAADIALRELVLFVGNNNSGKTLLMQLIYGIRKKIKNISLPIEQVRKSFLNGQLLIRCDKEWFREIETYLNGYLGEEKEHIIQDIFGVPIPIGELCVQLEDHEDSSFVSSLTEREEGGTGSRRRGICVNTLRYENGQALMHHSWVIAKCDALEAAVEDAVGDIWHMLLADSGSEEENQLFLPASRSGLQLLYKNYFAGGVQGNLAMPVRDFLRFQQLYSENENISEGHKALIEFGQKYLLQGKVVQKGDEVFYISEQGDTAVPLYIASSMIHELTPVVKALKRVPDIGWLFYDEVENSLHPLMQREMARWLIRMVNAGLHVVVSTHSDTMAGRLNNLFMLTVLNARRSKFNMLQELELQGADLLNGNVAVAVYEFLGHEDGTSSVKELEFIEHPLVGYDFKLFGDNLDKLYNESVKMME